jgi:hypothetical protein
MAKLDDLNSAWHKAADDRDFAGRHGYASHYKRLGEEMKRIEAEYRKEKFGRGGKR